MSFKQMLAQIFVVVILVTTSALHAFNMKGTKAPDFKLPDQDGEMHQLSDYSGQWLVLYFYPRDDTPGCTVEAQEFRDNLNTLNELNAIVMGISVDGLESKKRFTLTKNSILTCWLMSIKKHQRHTMSSMIWWC